MSTGMGGGAAVLGVRSCLSECDALERGFFAAVYWGRWVRGVVGVEEGYIQSKTCS